MFCVALFILFALALICKFCLTYMSHRSATDIQISFKDFLRDFQSAPHVFYCDYDITRCTATVHPDSQFDKNGNMNADFDEDDIEFIEDDEIMVDIRFSFIDYIQYCVWLYKLKRKSAKSDARKAMVEYMSVMAAIKSSKEE